MNKYIVSTIAFVALVMANVSCQRDERHIDERGLSISINAPESLEIRDITIWIHDNNNNSELVGGAREYYSLESMASELIDIPAGDYSVVAALNTRTHYNKALFQGNIGILVLKDIANQSTSAGESQTMIGTSRIIVESDEYAVCYVDIESPYITMSGEVNNIPEDVTNVSLQAINVSNAILPLFYAYSIYGNNTTAAQFGDYAPANESAYFSAIDFMPVPKDGSLYAPNGESLIFKVEFTYSNRGNQTYYFSTSPSVNGGGDGNQVLPIVPERGNSYLFRLNYDDMSAGYVNLGDVSDNTVVVNPWTPDNGLNGNLDGNFN